jgi:flagellar biosynthesis protein FlhF
MSPTIRTFRADNARSALDAVKAAFGQQAIILSTREVRGGLFRSAEIEITAALSDPRDDAPENQPQKKQPRHDEPPENQKDEPRPSALRGYGPPANADSEVSGQLLMLRGVVEEVRRELQSVTSPRTAGRDDLRMSPQASSLFSHLCLRGVEETLAEEAVKHAAAANEGGQAGLLNALRALFAERLVPGKAPWLRDQRRVIALVGPTGVGKTTTLAKIAARALMESRMKVSLITLDTYRIGASDQVARYGEIMNVPTHVAKDRAELAKAIGRSSDADLVLIDTAGRSMSEAVARQAELIRTVPGVQLHLVVSAATGARELAAVADRYKGLSPDRLLVTKVDEAAGPGSLLSAAVRVMRPIVAVADGQRVPEDLHDLSGAQLVDLVIGTWNWNRAERTSAGR